MDNEQLKLENQLCFPLYATAKEVVKRYKPYLEEIGLTYTQYIAMMVLWEHKTINVKTLGEYLYLDSGTLTPLLKRLESAGLIERNRDSNDERNVIIKLTPEGAKLKESASEIPEKIKQCLPITEEEAMTLYRLLYKILKNK
ncbi:MarR family winged helix-turn-helix transcriptional regulator [Acetobacterium carbinolicum]|uniref:MarR family winged helix-turn-helix transcriptional regulator n=1 Tax=Acetobacterium TaxID=33951 RepID=UPI000DBEBB4D|nr:MULTISPECIES: MarR family transcriptional regulator [unclassified Acetobacterium]AWW25746.1 MarR family transcriptional regulator [Acetobacterium sp. KB-1]MDK2941434.1 MarR family transcriptional regulator, organic hydroperoxide resistance regulator [Acetobacterium sp.]MDZ5726598.1 MarR family transcriptional regulator [Acetobacterium sp. K1/6]